MIIFKACLAVLMGISFTLNAIIAYSKRDTDDKLDLFTDCVLTFLDVYELFVIYNTTHYITTSFSCGILFMCAIYITLYDYECRRRIHDSNLNIKINKLESQNDLLRNQVKTMRMMRRDFIKDHYK